MSIPNLGPRGAELYTSANVGKLGVADRALVLEAARLLDRLERLDGLLRGSREEWARLTQDVETGEVTLVIDKLLSEARQQVLAYAKVAADMRAAGITAPVTKTSGEEGGDFVDELRAAREERERKAARAGAAEGR